jgi:hypothetical protein
MARICSLVSDLTSGLSFRARETVDLETWAIRAISSIVLIELRLMVLA